MRKVLDMNNAHNVSPVAAALLAQINALGVWFRARLGVQTILTDVDGLVLNCTRGVRIVIKLAADDTYTIESGKVRKLAWVRKSFAEGVYVDALGSAVEAAYVAGAR